MITGWIAGIGLAYSIVSGTGRNVEAAKQRKHDLQTQAKTWRQQADIMEGRAEDYATQAESALNQAAIKASNAGSKLEFGQDLYESFTDTFNNQRTQMGAAQGQSKAALGASAVEFGGSAGRLIAENAVQMSKDLQSLRKTTENRWGQTMAERKTDIFSKWNLEANASNFLESEQNYLDIEANYRSDAVWADNKADDVDTSWWGNIF